MDVIAALEAIMHQNTAYYQSDFAYDIKMLRETARSDQPEDKLLLWLSRPSGTFCFRERDVLLKNTQAYNTWKFCGEQTHDRILAYAVELTGAANGTVQGNLYELDYQQHFQHIRDAALPVGSNRLIYESGMREIGLKEHFDSRSDKYFGEFVRYEMQPRDPEPVSYTHLDVYKRQVQHTVNHVFVLFGGKFCGAQRVFPQELWHLLEAHTIAVVSGILSVLVQHHHIRNRQRMPLKVCRMVYIECTVDVLQCGTRSQRPAGGRRAQNGNRGWNLHCAAGRFNKCYQL